MNEDIIPSFLFSLKKETKVFDLLSNSVANDIKTVNPICICPICYNNVFLAFKPNNCSHLFCNYCISVWKKMKKKYP